MQTHPILLLAALFMCHYIADYQLTTPKMIAAKSHGKTYLPILQHAVIHATLMTICLLLFGVNFQIGLYLFVFVISKFTMYKKWQC